MKSNRILTIAALVIVAVALIAAAGCKSGGMAVTKRGQLLKINIEHPVDLPEQGEGDIGIVLGNRGMRNVKDVLLDVELPPQRAILDEKHERGVTMSHDPGSGSYHYTLSNLQPAEDSTIHFRIRAMFGTMSEIDGIKATAWQRDLPGDKLVETAVIKLRK
jgi:hypothetical protein